MQVVRGTKCDKDGKCDVSVDLCGNILANILGYVCNWYSLDCEVRGATGNSTHV